MIKEAYYKPLVYLAFNLSLFVRQTASADTAATAFEEAYQNGLLPYPVKVLFQGLLANFLDLRCQRHLTQGTQEEYIELASLSPQELATMRLMNELILPTLRQHLEIGLTHAVPTTATWRKAWQMAFEQMWSQYCQQRLTGQIIPLNHPLITCLADFPAPNGTHLSLDAWHRRKLNDLTLLLPDINQPPPSAPTDRPQPTLIVEWTFEQTHMTSSLHPEAVAQLRREGYLTEQRTLNFTQGQVERQEGRHLVMPVTITTPDHTTRTFYLKVCPEFPLLEMAVTEFSLLLIGPNLPWVQVVRLVTSGTSYPVLIAEGIPGTLLSKALLASSPSYSLVPAAYSARILFSLLANQEDAKPENFILKPSILYPEQFELISIDNDRSFYPAILNDTATQQFIPQIKDISLCFNEMYQPLHPEVREAFLALDAYQLLSFWLLLLQERTRDVEALFSEKDIKAHFPKRGLKNTATRFIRLLREIHAPEDSVLTLVFREGLLTTLYTKIVRLQTHLRCYPSATHAALLQVAEPYLAQYYLKLLTFPKTPLNRFYDGFACLYGIEEKASSNTASPTSKAKFITQAPTLRTLETQQGRPVTLETFLNQKNRSLHHNFEELNAIREHYHTYREIATLLCSDAEAFEQGLTRFQALSTTLQAHLIRRLNFRHLGQHAPKNQRLAYQKRVLDYLSKTPEDYPALVFRHCDALTLIQLETILQRSPQLQSLALIDCPQLSEQALILIGRYVPGLVRLVLKQLSWPTLSMELTALPQWRWFQDTKKALIPPWSQLEVLVIQAFPALLSLALPLKALTYLSVTECSTLKEFQLDCPSLTHSMPPFLARLAKAKKLNSLRQIMLQPSTLENDSLSHETRAIYHLIKHVSTRKDWIQLLTKLEKNSQQMIEKDNKTIADKLFTSILRLQETLEKPPHFKVLALSPQGGGKSVTLHRLVHGNYQHQKHTVGYDFYRKDIRIGSCSYVIDICDTSGQERFRTVWMQHCKDTYLTLISFDPTRENLILKEYIRYCRDILKDSDSNIYEKWSISPILIMTTKMDLILDSDVRSNLKAQALETANEVNAIDYIECSAKTGEGIEQLEQAMAHFALAFSLLAQWGSYAELTKAIYEVAPELMAYVNYCEPDPFSLLALPPTSKVEVTKSSETKHNAPHYSQTKSAFFSAKSPTQSNEENTSNAKLSEAPTATPQT